MPRRWRSLMRHTDPSRPGRPARTGCRPGRRHQSTKDTSFTGGGRAVERGTTAARPTACRDSGRQARRPAAGTGKNGCDPDKRLIRALAGYARYMIEVVLFDEEADSSEGSESDTGASTAEPPPPVGIFVDVEDGDPVGPAEEVVLDVAIF